jgi:hypothetical protein
LLRGLSLDKMVHSLCCLLCKKHFFCWTATCLI